MSRFFCDTNSDLWYTIADELGVDVISMPYSLDGEERGYDLGRNTDFVDYYYRLANGADAKTQALNMQNYIDYFEPVLQAGEDIIYVHFSRKLSGTFTQMDSAISYLKEKYPDRKITTVDTKMISLGEGLMVYEAAKLWKNGATDEEIVKFVKENINNYALYFTVKDLTQLKRGGRLSAVSFVAGTLLNIKPIIHVDEEGALNKCETVKGVKAGLRTLADKVKLLGDDVYNHMIIIAHADAPDFAQEIKAQLIHQFGENLNIFVQYIGPTVAAHCGVGTVGIAFHSKSR